MKEYLNYYNEDYNYYEQFLMFMIVCATTFIGGWMIKDILYSKN